MLQVFVSFYFLGGGGGGGMGLLWPVGGGSGALCSFILFNCVLCDR